ncbi:MAG: uracil-DNA glycosylase [Lamprocystis purpurea]|nr:uracil-DNA glycosylase [Lamprocystis purpurea]MBV5273166.1 uracil-DNA glycosylase [Lamprocystis purpurea]
MDESRRRAYLRAMGIDLWVPRRGAAAGGNERVTAAPAPAEPPPPAPAPVVLFEPLPELQSDSGWEPVWEPDWEPAPASNTMPAPADARSSTAPTSGQPRPGPTPPPTAATLPPDPTGMDWDTLAATVAGCRACALCETRTQTVFGVGDRQARLLVIGEAPGADEDRAGEPFVGRAGQLLNRMLAAIGFARDQIYIANILKCRPPGNRDPRPDEVEHCRGYLARQVELIRPRAMLSVGRISAQTLLGTDTPVGRLRGRWFDYGPDAVPLRVTYHPAYLLRSPEHKGKAWDDLTALAKRLGDSAD